MENGNAPVATSDNEVEIDVDDDDNKIEDAPQGNGNGDGDTLGLPDNSQDDKGDNFNASSIMNLFASETAYNSQNEIGGDDNNEDGLNDDFTNDITLEDGSDVDDMNDSNVNSGNEDGDALGFGKADLAQITQQYERQIADHDRIEQEMGERIQELTDSVVLLENQNIDKEKQIEKLERKLETAFSDSTDYKVLLEKHDNLSQQYKDILSKYEALLAEDYPAKLRSYQDKVLEYEQTIKSLQNENIRLQFAHDSINDKLLKTTELHGEHQGKIAAFEMGANTLKEQNEQLLSENNDLKKNYQMLVAYTKQQALIINQISKLGPNVSKLAKTFDGIKLNENDLNTIDNPDKLYNHLGRLSNASQILENSDFADQIQKEAEIEEEIEKYKEDIDEMKEAINERDNKLQILQNKIDNLTKNEELIENYQRLQQQYSSLSSQVSNLHESIESLTQQVCDKDDLITAMAKDKYETVSVLSKQLDFLRNLIKQHNLSVNLSSHSTANYQRSNSIAGTTASAPEVNTNQGILSKLGFTAFTSWIGTNTSSSASNSNNGNDGADSIAGQ